MRTDGVKSGHGCEAEGVTVRALRAVAPAARTVANLVPAGSNCFLGVSCALLSRLTSAKHRFRASNSRNGHLRRPWGVWRPRVGRVARAISLAPLTHLNMAASASHALPVPH